MSNETLGVLLLLLIVVALFRDSPRRKPRLNPKGVRTRNQCEGSRNA